MSPKKEGNSRRASPRKAEVAKIIPDIISNEGKNFDIQKINIKQDYNVINSNNAGFSSGVVSGSGDTTKRLKLRIKIKENGQEISGESTRDSGSQGIEPIKSPVGTSAPSVKIKLNFSRSSESVVSEQLSTTLTPLKIKTGKRGRPKKDKSAVMAAAIAASQPNELEREEKRSRRRAAQEKIKKSASSDTIKPSDNLKAVVDSDHFVIESESAPAGAKKRGRKSSVDVDGVLRKRRRRRVPGEDEDQDGLVDGRLRRRSNKSKSNEYIDITENNIRTSNDNEPRITSNTGIIGVPSFSPQETEFVQRSKTFLNIALQHDTFIYTSLLSNPFEVEKFKSIDDAVEKLAAFHVGMAAGQYNPEELIINARTGIETNHAEMLSSLQERYRSVIGAQASKKVATELLLLEQRLCLEEEKFLLVKLKNEYTARFLKPTSSSSAMSSSNFTSRSSTPNVM